MHEYVSKMKRRLADLHAYVRGHLDEAIMRQSLRYQQRLVRYEEGDRVWLFTTPSAQQIREKGSKLASGWSGPCLIKEKINPTVYRIITTKEKEMDVTIDRLKPYYAPQEGKGRGEAGMQVGDEQAEILYWKNDEESDEDQGGGGGGGGPPGPGPPPPPIVRARTPSPLPPAHSPRTSRSPSPPGAAAPTPPRSPSPPRVPSGPEMPPPAPRRLGARRRIPAAERRQLRRPVQTDSDTGAADDEKVEKAPRRPRRRAAAEADRRRREAEGEIMWWDPNDGLPEPPELFLPFHQDLDPPPAGDTQYEGSEEEEFEIDYLDVISIMSIEEMIDVKS